MTATYVVEFDRIGPRRDIPALTVELDDGDRCMLGEHIEAHARPYMAGLTPTASVDWDAEAGTLATRAVEVGQFTIGRAP